ncbi:hypothetical protein [Streptomyces carpinensis]|uniref:Uncharacterized protein n=1 Tax=Streptomyces carpinensis TaxID=66369 RepID=A0ABV1W9V3_9ACTN|nr:hypothetical protein [Streptomyces carpinensis]
MHLFAKLGDGGTAALAFGIAAGTVALAPLPLAGSPDTGEFSR